MQLTQERLEWADISKGIGIFFVVMGHTQLPFEFRKWIYSFHMPMFFILSGFFFSSGKYCFVDFVLRKIKTLLVPYMFFLAVTWAGFAIINHPVYMPAFSLKNILRDGPGSNPIWFLIVLYWVEVLFYIIDRIILQKKRLHLYVQILICLFCIICAAVTKYYVHFSLPYNLTVIPFYFFFYVLGYFHLIDVNFKISINLLILLLFFDIFIEHYMPYGIGLSDDWYLYFAGFPIAVLGTFLLFNFSYLLSANNCSVLKKVKKIICFYGRNSIVVLGLHTVIVRSLRCVFDLFNMPNIVSFPLRQLLLWFILAGVIVLLNRWTPMLIGKKSGCRV